MTSLVLVGIGLMRGLAWSDLFLMSVGLAVSAIPEGLPIAISIALAISMRRMAKCNVIVRRMPAVEALGSCTMIATDKTGTLTLNALTVTDIRLPDGTDLALDAGTDLDSCEIKAANMAVAGRPTAQSCLASQRGLAHAGREWLEGHRRHGRRRPSDRCA
ncbi:HAD-IC family P-type ATPase [Rhizobium lentis]|uniref:HAD-IC family P-type ATPase n=1 Tax=Rhizobium lentis TaxID=1138194 RepID=UPI0035C9412D